MAEDDFIPLDPSSSTKPARARKLPRSERVNTTVFVSSLPYNATTTDIITHFSFIGPVHHGFIAKDKESGTSKGVGYVTYALKEDAERAIEELDGGAFGDKGRKIRVTLADRKPEPGAEPEPKPKKETKQPRQSAAGVAGAVGSTDPNAIKTLVVTGLPKDLTKNVLWKKVRKISNDIDLVYPVEGQEDTAHLIFPTHNEAFTSIKKLHGHTYKGAIISCVLKKRLEKLSSSSHAGRLIVRNLSWDTTEKDLRSTFLPFGPIHSIDLPTLPSKLPPSADPSKPPPPPRARGFAFVWFLARKDAETAMEKVNGTVIKTSGGKEGRPVAVDWALSKDKWEETQKDKEPEKDKDVKPDIKTEDDDESEESGSDDEESGSEGAEDEDKPDVEMEEEPAKPQLPAVDVGSTLFIRNLPFETTEQELGALFRTFGPLRYARITIDKFTGRSRGSGFVCYWNVEHADNAIAEAEKVAAETGANAMPLGGQNPFALPTVLTADPSSSLVSKLVLHGRTLDVTRAVTREQAGQMREDGERARAASDKRNTYLMREGVVFPNSPAAENMPEAEVAKRQDAFNARKTLLRSNPSLYISKTRLSIRQLPLFVTDRTLKRLAIHAIRTFDAEVEASTREPLNRAEETDETVSEAIKSRTSKKKRGERDTAVIQSKIVRQTEKTDPITGQGKSKGYAFLEMRTHKDALKVLRYANNNPEVGKLMLEWYKIELGEMLEKAKKELRKKREGKSQPAAASDAASSDEDEDDKDEKKKEKKSVEKETKAEDGQTEEDLEARVKKIESGLQERQDGMRGGKTLLMEFSIENVQVVKRRGEKITAARDGTIGTKRKDREDDSAPAADGEPKSGKRLRGSGGAGGGDKREGKDRDRDGKRDKSDRKDKAPKHAAAAPAPAPDAEKKGIEKEGVSMGSMIGRKRRRKAGK